MLRLNIFYDLIDIEKMACCPIYLFDSGGRYVATCTLTDNIMLLPNLAIRIFQNLLPYLHIS